MLNVRGAGKVRYISAPPLKSKTFSENIQLFFSVFIDLLKVLVLSLVKLIFFPISVWFQRGPKSIKGQNVLVIFLLPQYSLVITTVGNYGMFFFRDMKITGGANGIGKATALELAKCGCNIIIADVDEEAAEKTLRLLRKYDVKSIAYSTDVSNPTEVEALKEAIGESLGPVDILVNNAGLMPLASLREGSSSDIERVVDVNINANFWTIRTFLPDMIKRKHGHIVQTSSMSALHPLPGAIVYTATKYAVTGLMLALEEELRQERNSEGIVFTTVHPYFVSTRLDLMNILNLRFSAITAEDTAKAIVNGIIYRKRRVVVPHYDALLTSFLRILPYSIQCLARDYILREPESRVIKDPFVYVS